VERYERFELLIAYFNRVLNAVFCDRRLVSGRCAMMPIAAEFRRLSVISLSSIDAMRSSSLYRGNVHLFCPIYRQTFWPGDAWKFVSDLLWGF
jgi:hypothetical protein